MEQKDKGSLGAILFSLMLCTYAVLVFLSLAIPMDQLTAGYTTMEEQDDIIIAPYELTKREQELVSLTGGRALSWIFNLHGPDPYDVN